MKATYRATALLALTTLLTACGSDEAQQAMIDAANKYAHGSPDGKATPTPAATPAKGQNGGQAGGPVRVYTKTEANGVTVETTVTVGENGAKIPQETGDFCAQFEGAQLIAADGNNLGVLTRYPSPNSLFHPHTQYANENASYSIWNVNRPYGGEGEQSPFNPAALRAPYAYGKNAKRICTLTRNAELPNACDTDAVLACFQ